MPTDRFYRPRALSGPVASYAYSENPAAAAPAAGPKCPRCGRSVHRLPDGRLLSLQPLVCGWTFAAHICHASGARYPVLFTPN